MDSESLLYEFSESISKNIQLLEDKKSAIRTKSYNQAIVCITKPLCKGHSISIKVDQINSKWKGTIALGALGNSPTSSHFPFPTSAILFRRPCWIATHDYININGSKIQSKYGEILEQIEVGTIITMTLTHSGSLLISMGQNNLEELATGLPHHVYPVFDLYGRCEKISVMNSDVRNGSPINEEVSLTNSNEAGIECDNNVPQCEKADLEVHEKETEVIIANPGPSCSMMTRSVMESVSENLLMNLSIKNRSMETRPDPKTDGCCLRESLQLQHSTNLNIQRSQSTQRFNSGGNLTSSMNDTNRDDEHFDEVRLDALTNNDSNYLESTVDGEENPENNEEQPEEPILAICSGNLSLPLSNLNQGRSSDNLSLVSSSHSGDLTRRSSGSALDSLRNLRTHSESESIPDSIENKDCEFLKLVIGFKRTLVLPDAFFSYDYPSCYCIDCTAGGKIYEVNGWVRFKLNPLITSSNHCSFTGDGSDWTTAFYQTRVDKIRSILDHGQPLPIEPCEAAGNNQKDDSGPGTHLILSSSPNSEVRPQSTFAHRYMSGSTVYTIGTAFEVRVKTQSLCGLETETEDGAGGSSSLTQMWTTKEAGACVLTALLLKLIPIETENH